MSKYHAEPYIGKKNECGIDYTSEDDNGKRVYTNKTVGEYSAFGYVKKTIEYIKTRDAKKPFFVYLPFQSVHMPLEAPEEYIKPYRKEGVDKKRAVYSGMVAVLDEAVGNVTSYLKENNLWNDTLILGVDQVYFLRLYVWKNFKFSKCSNWRKALLKLLSKYTIYSHMLKHETLFEEIFRKKVSCIANTVLEKTSMFVAFMVKF